MLTGSGTYLSAFLPVDRETPRPFYLLGSALFFVAAAWGIWLSRHQLAAAYHLLLFPFYFCTTHFFGAGEERYSIAMIPMLAVFAGIAGARLATR